MKTLAMLPAAPRYDKKSARVHMHELEKAHPGRMKVQAARSAALWLIGQTSRPFREVADALCGVGTTAVALAPLMPARFVLCEAHPFYWAMARAAVRSVRESLVSSVRLRDTVLLGDAAYAPPTAFERELDLIFQSPMFPKTHSQGNSALQTAWRAEKGIHAGNDVPGMDDWKGERRWKASLRRVTSPFAAQLRLRGYAVIHVKNHVERAREVRVDGWAADALEGLHGLALMGCLVVPLRYRSAMREIHRWPLRKIIGRSGGIDLLECGHTKPVKNESSKKRRCAQKGNDEATGCPPLEDRDEVTEERFVVFRKEAPCS